MFLILVICIVVIAIQLGPYIEDYIYENQKE